jgi:hypothetical protein
MKKINRYTPQWLAEKIHFVDRQYLKGQLSLLRFCKSFQEYRELLRANENPIVIGGCARSGTTLLLSLISAHPRVYCIPYETKALCPNAYDPNPVDADLTDPPPFYIDFLYEHLIDYGFPNHEEVRWCEKTPMNVHFVDRLIDFFGNGFRFINLVRDGRDVVTSQHPQDPDRYWVPPERWIRDVRAGRRLSEKSEVLTVRYEDLTDDYRSVMKEICTFIDEPYTVNAFETYPESADIQSSGAWFKDASEVKKRHQKRWNQEKHSEVVDKLMKNSDAIDHLIHYDYI